MYMKVELLLLYVKENTDCLSLPHIPLPNTPQLPETATMSPEATK